MHLAYVKYVFRTSSDSSEVGYFTRGFLLSNWRMKLTRDSTDEGWGVPKLKVPCLAEPACFYI